MENSFSNKAQVAVVSGIDPGSRPSFSLHNKLQRVMWKVSWQLFARWTPPALHPWRRLILRLFGAEVAAGARVHGSAVIWHPRNISIGEGSLIGPGVYLYNQGFITIGSQVIISQRAHVCASSHRISDRNFKLVTRPIIIEDRAWIAAEAFVGPGVRVRHDTVIGARAAVFQDTVPFGVYVGNPAELKKMRVYVENTQRSDPE